MLDSKIYELLLKIGVTIFNNEGEIREFTDVINDIQNVWDKLNQEEQSKIANDLFNK